MTEKIVFIVTLLLLFFDNSVVRCGFYQKKLLQELFDPSRPDAHNPLELPVANDSKPLSVYLKISLVYILNLDEKNQVLTTNLWLDMYWTDYHFNWNPRQYGNVYQINVPLETVWHPDILLYNSANEKFVGTYSSKVLMYSNSMMAWVPPGMFKSTCPIDITWFPFDTQMCHLKFGSWTYNGNFIDLKLSCNNTCTTQMEADTKSYVINGEFEVMKAVLTRYTTTYVCCPDEPYIDIKLNITIQRKSLYYTFNLILPCAIISCMTLLEFLVPPDAGEKISLGVTILLSMTMFLLLVADKLPQTSDSVPLVGIYFVAIMIMCSLSIVFSVLVLNYHHRSVNLRPLPKIMDLVLCQWVAKILCMKREDSDESEIDSDVESLISKSDFTQTDKNNVFDTDLILPNSHSVELNKWENNRLRSKPQPSKSLLANVLDLNDDARRFEDPDNILSTIGNTAIRQNAKQNFDQLRQYNENPGNPPPSYTDFITSLYKKSNSEGQKVSKPSSEAFNLLEKNDNFSAGKTHIRTSEKVSPSISSDSSVNVPHLQSLTSAQISSVMAHIKPLHRCNNQAVDYLQKIVKELRIITQKMHDEEEEISMAKDWKFVARVVDRLCLYVFSASLLLITTIIVLLGFSKQKD